ncbi:hypothetical protein BDN71DRAFT_1511575 [Pleurotus eryngii]|uniref:Uncharacterized protein n=1 Tax=Pleurotus eryngii TaxID=5323 RepID=A0A9P5ZPN6_PLEER|nr:hypothetical protein BDN71DRAFT_1511575 [Pleurotus eryngii]
MIDCPKVLHWTPSAPQSLLLQNGVEIEYLEDGNTRWEDLVTGEEADEIVSRVVYDELDVAHIAVTRTLSVGTSTVWFKVERNQTYIFEMVLDVCLVVEFGNSEECIRFLHGDMRELKLQDFGGEETNIAAIDDIMRALVPVTDDLNAAKKNAARRGIPFSQFKDEYQPETQFIRHQASDRGDDRPCYLTLDISIYAHTYLFIRHVDWSATNSPPISPSHSNAFQSLNNIHLNFPLSAQDDRRNNNPSSQNSTEPLSFTVEASGIHGLTGTNSVARGNSITISSEHRNVHVNLAGLLGVSLNINFISGDSYFGAISSSNIGGMNNVNTSAYLIVTLET